jgi:hypothetical protein
VFVFTKKEDQDMRKKFLGSLGTAILLIIAVFAPTLVSSAQTGTGFVNTGYNQVMTQAEVNRTRTCAYDYVNIQAFAVYPYGTYSSDNYTYCRTRLYKYNTNAQPISAITTIYEGLGYYSVYIYEYYIELTSQYDICFASPDNNRAVVYYGYDGL